MPYSKHTNMELLAECYNCIGDLLQEIATLTDQGRTHPKALALREAIYQRTKGDAERIGRSHGD